ncbi:DUF1931 family protein [Aquicella lusitana]|uniref:Uncharacterized protein DUF1931 n=1 Tax=Aquicella lusitana TaxID=254246 RepID=A0A370G1E6_9COXI|nr:DUF1931 family protein [Aquicella lusitana]RDI37565.1 uncharacterized protein DUF1931 [Aquicella lusitana]VVC74691.1 hypothetical protein AQULUS_24570 [Aquicella lusitana]
MVMAVKQFQKLFRTAAGLNVDKNDIKRLSNFINERLADLLLLGPKVRKLRYGAISS